MADTEAVIKQEILTAAQLLAARLDQFLGDEDPTMAASIDDAAGYHARHLLSEDPDLSMDAAHVIRRLVGDQNDLWWRYNPLAHALARVDGYGTEWVPRRMAAAILDITRQRISQLEQTGALTGSLQGVSNESLINRLRSQGRK